MANVTEINAEQFDSDVATSQLPVVVDFYAPWCGPCRMLAPVLDAISQKYVGRARFVKVNVDDAPELAERFSVSGVPTLLFVRDGKEVDRVVGFVPPQMIAAKIERLLPVSAG